MQCGNSITQRPLALVPAPKLRSRDKRSYAFGKEMIAILCPTAKVEKNING